MDLLKYYTRTGPTTTDTWIIGWIPGLSDSRIIYY